MVNEFVYCPRLFYYEWVEGVFAHSADTIEGAHAHARVDDREDALPPPDDDAPVAARSVTLSSERHGVIAKIDLVEGDGASVTPVDYKKGAPHRTEDGPAPWPADRVQVGVQALVLRERGYTCREGVLYYRATKQRVRVPVDDALMARRWSPSNRAPERRRLATIPAPLVDSPKCPRCSLVGICLPDETALIQARRPESGSLLQLAALRWDRVRLRRGFDRFCRPSSRAGARRSAAAVRHRAGSLGRPVGRSPPGQGPGAEASAGGAFARDESGEPVWQCLADGARTAGALRGRETDRAFLLRRLVLRNHAGAWCSQRVPQGRAVSPGGRPGVLPGDRVPDSRGEDPQPADAAAAQPCRAAARCAGTVEGPCARAEAAAALDQLLGIEGTAARLYFGAFAGMIKVDDASSRRSLRARESAAAAGSGERVALARVQSPVEGPDDRLRVCRSGSVLGFLSSAAVRPAGAGARSDGDVPSARGGLGGTERRQYGHGGRRRVRAASGRPCR